MSDREYPARVYRGCTGHSTGLWEHGTVNLCPLSSPIDKRMRVDAAAAFALPKASPVHIVARSTSHAERVVSDISWHWANGRCSPSYAQRALRTQAPV